MKKTIGNTERGTIARIIERKEALGLTSKALSSKAGLGETALSRYLRGERKLPAEALKKLAPHLEASAGWLLTGEDREGQPGDPSRRPTEAEALLRKAEECDDIEEMKRLYTQAMAMVANRLNEIQNLKGT